MLVSNLSKKINNTSCSLIGMISPNLTKVVFEEEVFEEVVRLLASPVSAAFLAQCNNNVISLQV